MKPQQYTDEEYQNSADYKNYYEPTFPQYFYLILSTKHKYPYSLSNADQMIDNIGD